MSQVISLLTKIASVKSKWLQLVDKCPDGKANIQSGDVALLYTTHYAVVCRGRCKSFISQESPISVILGMDRISLKHQLKHTCFVSVKLQIFNIFNLIRCYRSSVKHITVCWRVCVCWFVRCIVRVTALSVHWQCPITFGHWGKENTAFPKPLQFFYFERTTQHL